MEGVQEIAEAPKRSPWAHYEALASGLRNYWYPVFKSRQLRRKPIAVKLFGENVVFVRDQGRAYALADHCPHRGTPLSLGRQDFRGTISCRYHGWCFSLSTGQLVAALTDGPDSPILGKVSVRTYPVEERIGLTWIYMGDGAPSPVEADIPDELLGRDVVVGARITRWPGNWRYAVENHFDDAHASYLHRYGALFSAFWDIPAWKRGIRVVRNGEWLDRQYDALEYESEYSGLGRWPKRRFWIRNRMYPRVSVRLPSIGRVAYPRFTAYKFFTPVDKDGFLFTQVMAKRCGGVRAALFRVAYWLYRRWIYLVQFNDQDMLMVRVSHRVGPERLFGPDVSIIAWRKLCEEARGVGLRSRETEASVWSC